MFSPLLKATAKDTGVDLTEGLVAHYLLNNNADDCQGTYDGTPTDVDFQGDVGYFNGTTSNIAIPSLGFGTSFSFGFWVYTNDNTVEQRIVAYNDTTDGVFFIGRILATGKFNLYVKSATTLNIDSTTTPANGTMYHIFGNINESGTCELFVDSISENSDTVGAFTVAVGDRYIGANRLGEVHNTDGGISNIRFYSTT